MRLKESNLVPVQYQDIMEAYWWWVDANNEIGHTYIYRRAKKYYVVDYAGANATASIHMPELHNGPFPTKKAAVLAARIMEG